jgi:hypothetical protein
MTDLPIEQLNLLDTEYADILTNSSSPDLELRLVQLGINPGQARSQIRFMTLVQHKPKTIEEIEELMKAWEAVWGSKPTKEEVQLIARLLWNRRESSEFDQSKVDEFLADCDEETHTGQEWENLAIAAGLNQKEIDAVFDYLDSIH